jgi:hypothetical protein
MKRFLMDLSVNCCGRSANLSLVESYVSWLERRHVTAVLRREHAYPNLFTEIYCFRTTIAISSPLTKSEPEALLKLARVPTTARNATAS